MTKRRWIGILALVLVTGATMPLGAAELPPGGTFVDDDGSLHEPNIEAIAAAGITAGCGATHYCPGLPVTRAQMGSFITRALDLPIPTGNRFADVSGTHLEGINAIAEAGISVGCNADGSLYCPNEHVSREQMASFLARALGLSAPGPNPFVDVSGTHTVNIIAIAEAGITSGCDNSGILYCRASLSREPRWQPSSPGRLA